MGMRLLLTAVLLLSGWLASGATNASSDLLIADFEGVDYGLWQVTGDAFGRGPAQGTLPGQMKVEGFQGKGLANSFNKGDAAIGTLTSPAFIIQRRNIQFLIGGGKNPGKTCINLLVGGQVVRTATGPNDRPGGSERLDSQGWDVAEFAGKEARIQIVDEATGPWGHINVDQIIQTDRDTPTLLTDVSRKLLVNKRYLNLPVKNEAPKRRVSLMIGGKAVREFEIELADEKPDFWVFLDLAPFKGQQATLKVDHLLSSSSALDLVEQDNRIRDAEDLYREGRRPQFHFSSRRGWNNDPNGLVFYKGEYHLYYQHNPYGWDWGNMHWGHAISRDLVHWEELPIAVYPQTFGDWAFSGSALVDAKNSGGFKSGSEDALVAAYTSTGRGECILYSNDRGRTWNEYSGNPVVKHEGRDPRLLWYAPGSHWVMALYDEFEKGRYIAFYTSPDLKTWTFQSRIEGFFECPDLFELPVDGKADNKKWVLTAASSEYMVGTFDGKKFTPETPKLPGHRGDAFYAAQTYSDIPANDGRCVQVGWGPISTPGMPFNQMMCFPCELTLRTTADGPRLAWEPVREIRKLRGKTQRFDGLTVKPGDANPLSRVKAELVELMASFEPGKADSVLFDLRGVQVSYDVARGELRYGKLKVAVPAQKGSVTLRFLLDQTSLEIFGNSGLAYIPTKAAPDQSSRSVGVIARGGVVKFSALEFHELKSIWR
jgi:fructan beta-fructosidase